MTLNDAIFMEINPVPVKAALGLMGKISPDVRLPLSPLSDSNCLRLKQILSEYQLI
jgi:4-hydroxy-tetrahydrodipicolinate synthase